MPNPNEYNPELQPDWLDTRIPEPTHDDLEEVKRRLDEIFEPVPTTPSK